MINLKEMRYTLEYFITQICKEGFCNRPQLLYAVWEAVKKIITLNTTQGKQTLLSNLFIAHGNRQFSKYYFIIQPTQILLNECSLKYRAETFSSIEGTATITQTNLFKTLNASEKQYFKNDKQLSLRLFYLLMGKIKDALKINRNLQIFFEQFGTIRLSEKTYFFEPFKLNDKSSFSTPNLHKFKRFSSTNKKENNTIQKSAEQSKINNKFLQNPNITYKKGFHLRKRPYFHEVIVQNEPPSVKICGDLLGAGIDPLTYDYSYSKLTDHSPQLLNMEFKRQQHAQGRLPCVIDKFARTKGSQLTGIKVGNSIVVRIGSNYSPTAKNYYLDIASKSIQLVTPEVKIKLDNHRQRVIQPATELEEYLFVTGMNNPHLEARVELRKEMYSRYCQYYKQIIPNDCVAQLSEDKIERIIKQIKNLVKKLGRKDGSPLVNHLINQVNSDYYLSYKKSILNYILRDKQQMIRIGIIIPFSNLNQWGKCQNKNAGCQISSLDLSQAKKILQLNHILYPDCLNKIYQQNENLTKLEIFKKRKEGEYRPYNILYYIKRNTHQLNEAYNFLCESWAKKISQLIEQHINLKQQNYQKLKQFFNSIHIVMSNKLKQLLYTTLNNISYEFKNYDGPDDESKNLLMINMTEQNQKICFIDDIQKVFKIQIIDIIDKIIEMTRRIPRVENCLKLSTEIFIWGIDSKDSLLSQTKQRVKQTIEENYFKILGLKQELSKLQVVFKLKEQIINWCKQPLQIQSLKEKLFQIQLLQKDIMKIKCYYKVSMIVVDCIELKRKLILYLKSLKKLLFDHAQDRIKQKNSSILAKIQLNIQLVSKSVSSTTQFVALAHDIDMIKSKQMAILLFEIDSSFKDVMSLFSIQGFSANFEVMKSTYLCRQSYQQLHLQLFKNQRRLSQERGELEKRLREKINHFQTQTLTWLKEINSKIQNFDMRKLFSEYLTILADYQGKVQSNREVQRILNSQQEDLKWAVTTFTHAVELENVVQPNYELWQLVSQYDTCLRQWKYIELSHFDIQNNEIKVSNIDSRITRLITKLKNFAGLKIVYDLQNDVKQFLVQQVPIIKIFSNPGLKDRHWSLFNKRLPLPGYDLKQLTYGRIKLLYQFQKNLKVLMSISNQAAKQFQIENQKQEMFDYWSRLNFSLYHANDENIIFINQIFLDEQIEAIEHHLTKTVILKNSPFSKALVQMLGQWQGWLINGRKILSGFRASQQKFMVVRSIFKMDEISKILPIESTEYDSIENIWKSVIKKILEQPKVTQFFKSQKMPQIIEQIGKKADFIRNSFNTYLNLKRLQFNRLYLLPQKVVLCLIEFIASDRLLQAYKLIIEKCFIGVTSISRDDSSNFLLTSRVDKLNIVCETSHSKKGKGKFFEELVILQKNMRQNIKKEIKQLTYTRKPISQIIDNYTLTALFTYFQLQFGTKITDNQSLFDIQIFYKAAVNSVLSKMKKQISLKYQNILSKLFFLRNRCEEISKKQSFTIDSIFHFFSNGQDLSLNIYRQNISFQYQYIGDEAVCFLPISTDRLLWNIAFSIKRRVGILCEDNAIIREISLFCGQYYVRIDNPLHQIGNNFQSCVMGVVSTNYWIHFVDDYIKANADLFAMLTHTYQQKKERIQNNISSLTFKNNQIMINQNTCLFISISPTRSKDIPPGILTCTRSITFNKPDVGYFSQYLTQCQQFDKIKTYLFALKLECQKLNPNKILKQTQTVQNWVKKRQNIKNQIWKLLNNHQRVFFNNLFEQKMEIEDSEPKSWPVFKKLKQQELIFGLQRHTVVLAVGKQNCKSSVIQTVLKQKSIQHLFSQQRGLNLNFIQEGFSDFNCIKYLEKAKEKLTKSGDQIIIYLDCDLSSKHLQAISIFQHIHSLSLQHKKPMKLIIQTYSLQNLDPKQLLSYAIISFHSQVLQNSSIFQWWVGKQPLNPEDRQRVSQLENNFQSILNFVLKMEKRLFNDSKAALTKRFFSYFSIYLSHLNSKEVQRMCQFDRDNYIFNSFIYCAFWALGGNLRSIQTEALKKYIRQTYSQKLDMPGQLNDIYLNDQNEWVYWQSLKLDFVSEKENVPLYQIWVPTATNTKILMMLMKLIEASNSILLCGSQSGKSSIFSQISSFQLSYNTFFIDCHCKTSINHLTSLTKGRIIYGEFKKNLILVDDVHLAPIEVCDVLRVFSQRGYCVNTGAGKLNQDIFCPLILASWQGQQETTQFFWRFYERMIPIEMQKFEEGELQTILRTYFNALPLNNEVDNNFLKLSNIIVNFCMHTLKAFPSIKVSNIRLLVESMCRCNFSKQQSTILQHLLTQSQSILQILLPSHQITHFYRHLSYYYGKLLSVQLKNHNQIKQVAESYLYDIRSNKEPDKKQTIEEIFNWIAGIISEKSSQLFVSYFHVKIIQKLLWTLKANKSHIILLSSIKNGCRSLARITGWLLKIGIIQLHQIGVNGLLEQVIKVLKTGGKIDQCMSILTHELINARPQLIKLINSLIFSPQFHQCFGQILMEQIIKSFNSEKKFLKKNVKKSQLIKKIRQKFNNIFHLCICVTRSSYNTLLDTFPKFAYLRVIQVDDWPFEALSMVAKKFVPSQSEDVLKAVFKLEEQLKNGWEVCASRSKGVLNILSTFDKIIKFMEQKAKSQQQSTELWSKRIRLSQDKLQNLQNQKKVFQTQHSEYFEKISSFDGDIGQAQLEAENAKQKCSEMQKEVERYRQQCNKHKIQFQKLENHIHKDFQNHIESMKHKLIIQSLNLKQNEKIELISMAYQFPIDNLQHRIDQLFYQLQKDYFHKLRQLDYSDLGYFTSIIKQFQLRMQQLQQRQNALSIMFRSYETMNTQFKASCNLAKNLEDRVSILRDQQSDLRENEEVTLKAYEDIKQKIAQVQSINSILLKFQHILKSKNQLTIPVPKNMNAAALLVTYLLTYFQFIQSEKLLSFSQMIISKLESLKFQTSAKQLLSFFNYQLQFKMLYQHEAKITEIVNYFGLQSSDIGCIAFGEVEDVISWLDMVAQSRPYVWMKNSDDIRELLQRDQLILIKNPDSTLIEKLSSLLSKPFIIRNTTKIIIVQDEEITIHENSKFLLVYDHKDKLPNQMLIHNLFILKIWLTIDQKILQIIEKKLNQEKAIGNRIEFVNSYLKGCRQIGMMDQKLHSIIMKMKKENVVSEIIYKKIEEEGQNKAQNERKLEKYKQQILDISKNMLNFSLLAKQITLLFLSFNISFKQFKNILLFYINKLASKNFDLLISKLTKFFNKLRIDNSQIEKSEKLKEKQFENELLCIMQGTPIILLTPDISLAIEFIKSIFYRFNQDFYEIGPEDLSINNIKQNGFYICSLSRFQQWKQPLLISEMQKDKFQNLKVLFVVLESIFVPPEILVTASQLTFTRIGQLLVKAKEVQNQQINLHPRIQFKSSLSIYQTWIQYNAYIEAKREGNLTDLARTLLLE